MENRDRTDAWRRNDTLEGLLGELSGLLGPAEERLNALDAGAEPLPVVLVVGPPRSGTTLTMQLLAATGLCAYPTNLLSRFYARPRHRRADPAAASGSRDALPRRARRPGARAPGLRLEAGQDRRRPGAQRVLVLLAALPAHRGARVAGAALRGGGPRWTAGGAALTDRGIRPPLRVQGDDAPVRPRGLRARGALARLRARGARPRVQRRVPPRRAALLLRRPVALVLGEAQGVRRAPGTRTGGAGARPGGVHQPGHRGGR